MPFCMCSMADSSHQTSIPVPVNAGSSSLPRWFICSLRLVRKHSRSHSRYWEPVAVDHWGIASIPCMKPDPELEEESPPASGEDGSPV